MIWLIGNKGMLGQEIEILLKSKQIDVYASDIEVDITDLNALKKFSDDKSIKWIINCSAYTAVDQAEEEKEKAFLINETGVKNIAQCAKDIGATLIHFSTDYVFNGQSDDPYFETDHTDPTGVYGSSKLAGELIISEIMTNYIILRISWLYGKYGNNFVKTMMRLFKERDKLTVVNDQFGSPTCTIEVAEIVLKIIESNKIEYGIYHLSGEGKTTWYDFASEINTISQELSIIENEVEIEPVSTEQYPTKAQRPKNSYMSKEKIKSTFNVTIKPWQEMLRLYMKENY